MKDSVRERWAQWKINRAWDDMLRCSYDSYVAGYSAALAATAPTPEREASGRVINCAHSRIYPNGDCISCGVFVTSAPGTTDHVVVPRNRHIEETGCIDVNCSARKNVTAPAPLSGDAEIAKWKATADIYMLDALHERENLIKFREHVDKNYVHRDNAERDKRIAETIEILERIKVSVSVEIAAHWAEEGLRRLKEGK